jgi:AAA domain
MPKFNPFRPNSLVTPGMFSGRGRELQHTARALFQIKNGNPQHFLFEGERGIGKSSLFRYLDWVARGDIPTIDDQRHKFVVVNVELREMMGHGDVVDRIFTGLQTQIDVRVGLKEKCKKVVEFLSRFEAYGIRYRQNEHEARRDGLNGLTDALVNLQQEAGDEIDGVLLLIDEADKPLPSAHLGELCKLLTERLSYRGCERVGIGLAGLPGLVGKLRASHESAPSRV